MRSLKIQISKTDADATVHSLEVALEVLSWEYEALDADSFTPQVLRTTIESLQMLRLSFMLASRNAAKEAAPKSAKTAHPFKCGCRECMPAVTNLAE